MTDRRRLGNDELVRLIGKDRNNHVAGYKSELLPELEQIQDILFLHLCEFNACCKVAGEVNFGS